MTDLDDAALWAGAPGGSECPHPEDTRYRSVAGTENCGKCFRVLTDAPPYTPLVIPKRCRRHEWGVTYQNDGRTWTPCLRCDHVRNDAASKRGRTNRQRGLAIQRKRVRAAGGENVPGNGPYDGRSSMFRFESKSGAAFPKRLWGWLRGIPVTTETPVLIVTETPGPGRKARSVVVLDFDDWTALHGPEVDR